MSVPTISDIAGVTTQPELKFTNSGKAVLNMRLAFNDSKYDEQQKTWINTRTFYVDGTAWEQTAERVAEWLAQGDQVYVTGRLETQQWEDKDGQKRSKPILNVQAIRKLAPAAKQQQNTQQSAPAQQGQGWGGQQATPAEDPWGAPSGQQSAWGNGPTDANTPPF